MRIPATRRLIGLVSLVIILSVEPADACTCAGEPPPCEAFSGATAVFVGVVLDAAQQKEHKNEDGTTSVYDVGSIRFQVTEAFSGVTSSIVVISSGTGGADCGYWFKRRESYLVYAFGEPEQLSTSFCTRTAPISDAGEDLVFLRNLPKTGTGGALFGVVNRVVGDVEHGPTEVSPMVGVKVIIEGARVRRELFTDADGRYGANGLPEGEYDVRLDIPANLASISRGDTADRYGTYSGHEKTRVYDRGCIRNDFGVQSNGRIGGKLTDAAGKPIKELIVDLVNVAAADKGWFAVTDSEGRYEFRMVQPGRYLLGVNLQQVPDDQNPYSRTYYPGVVEEDKATVIDVGDGEKIEGLNLVLTSQLIERAVVGVATWPDGRPANGARVFFELRDEPGRSRPKQAEAGADGSFSLSLFDGRAYVIFAHVEAENSKYVHSKALELTPGDATNPIRLILSEPGSGIENTRIMKGKKAERDGQTQD